MKNKTINALLFALMIIFVLHFASPSSNAQTTKRSKEKSSAGKQKGEALKAQKGETNSKSGSSEDPNIKENEILNDPDAEKTAPDISRLSSCKVILDNSTNYKVQVYINGKYQGVLGGLFYTEIYLPAPQTLSVYFRADFTDGSYYYWGPKTYECLTGKQVVLDVDF